MNKADENERLSVATTYKLYIGGKFPRTESGRTFEIRSTSGELLANLCRASRKDLREAVVFHGGEGRHEVAYRTRVDARVARDRRDDVDGRRGGLLEGSPRFLAEAEGRGGRRRPC